MALVLRAGTLQASFLDSLPATRLKRENNLKKELCRPTVPSVRNRRAVWQAPHYSQFLLPPAVSTKFRRNSPKQRHARCEATAPSGSVEPELDRRIQEKALEVAEALTGVNVYLVGMMGSGKSTIGKVLAERLRYRFFDSDEVIEGAVGAPVSQIFKENGEETFRKLETEVLSQLARETRSVISTGGGAVLRKENWSSMHYGISVFLQVPIQTLAKRVTKSGHSTRPLLNGGEETDEDAESQALMKLSSIWKDRKGFYETADVTVSIHDDGSEELSTEHLVEKVLSQIDTLLRERGVKKPQESTEWISEL